jgi:hypothetical protein
VKKCLFHGQANGSFDPFQIDFGGGAPLSRQ